jgi:Ser/Thr protein kinase RdoA (MazF antagonist)
MTDDSLGGGNMNAVRKVGDTVRRTAGPWTKSVHAYLDHLRGNGVSWVPRALGLDDEGREILSFIDGTVPAYPLPSWVWHESVLTEGGRMLRQLHDASLDFPLLTRADAAWQLPSHDPVEVMCHNDFAPHNLVFDDEGVIVGAIDFDMCSPGPRLWDVAYFATRAVPLAFPRASEPTLTPNELRRRIELVLAGYGSRATWDEVIRMAITRLHDIAEFSLVKAHELGNPELGEHAAGYRQDAAHLTTLIAQPL